MGILKESLVQFAQRVCGSECEPLLLVVRTTTMNPDRGLVGVVAGGGCVPGAAAARRGPGPDLRLRQRRALPLCGGTVWVTEMGGSPSSAPPQVGSATRASHGGGTLDEDGPGHDGMVA